MTGCCQPATETLKNPGCSLLQGSSLLPVNQSSCSSRAESHLLNIFPQFFAQNGQSPSDHLTLASRKSCTWGGTVTSVAWRRSRTSTRWRTGPVVGGEGPPSKGRRSSPVTISGNICHSIRGVHTKFNHQDWSFVSRRLQKSRRKGSKALNIRSSSQNASAVRGLSSGWNSMVKIMFSIYIYIYSLFMPDGPSPLEIPSL